VNFANAFPCPLLTSGLYNFSKSTKDVCNVKEE